VLSFPSDKASPKKFQEFFLRIWRAGYGKQIFMSTRCTPATRRALMSHEDLIRDDELFDEDSHDTSQISPEWLARFQRPLPQRETPNLHCLADLADQPAQWLWPGRVPRGALTLLSGQPGRGKSLLALDIAARVTAGQAWPDGRPGDSPGDVLILSAEDSIGRTVRSRLIVHGADLQRVFYLNSGVWADPTQPLATLRDGEASGAAARIGLPSWSSWALYRDARDIKAALEYLPECRLVVIDPIPAYLEAGRLNSLEAAREFLGPLASLADRTGAAVIAVMPCDSRPTDKRQYAERAMAEMARAIYLIECHESAPDGYALIPLKNNLGDARTALSFSVTGAPDEPAAKIAWNSAPFEFSARDLVPTNRGRTAAAPRQTEVDRAIAWVQGALAAGPVPSAELFQRAAAAGITRNAFYRARMRLGIEASNDKQIGGAWNCSLPASEGEAAEISTSLR
jgi:putative DNA primase/helicase